MEWSRDGWFLGVMDGYKDRRLANRRPAAGSTRDARTPRTAA